MWLIGADEQGHYSDNGAAIDAQVVPDLVRGLATAFMSGSSDDDR